MVQNQAVGLRELVERPWAAGVVLALCFVACSLNLFSEDVWQALLIGAPFVVVLVTAVLTPVHVPSSALF
ncbi:MAG: hypothetical protein M3Y49_13635, partial [Actinomycetota bacterium]|nr:hypothetical protein [Actinomycetota bacterium]